MHQRRRVADGGAVKTILYVDDNADELLLFEAACRMGRVAFALQTVEGSAAGLAYLAGEGPYADRQRYPFPDAVLLDIKMAGVNGFDMLHRLRADPAHAGLPVVLFTSSVLPADATYALKSGADACVSKPVDLTHTMRLAREIDTCLTDGGWTERLARFGVG
jgi:CheY-like chemotaxis protein